MTLIGATLDQERLEAILRQVDPAVVLVPARILRRVIKRARSLTGASLQVPHRKCFVIGRDALWGIADRRELGIPAERELPATLLLLAETDAGRLAAMPSGEVLRKYWRLLFHAQVHAELECRCADGKLSDTVVRARVAQIGRTELEAATAILRQENMLLPPGDLRGVYQEFAAVYLELRHFDPHRLPLFFPLARFEEIDRVLAQDVDAPALLARTRPEGAAEPAVPPETLDEHHELAASVPDSTLADAAAFVRLSAAARRSRQRGNLVRAALRSERAARVGTVEQQAEARRYAAADLDRLAGRLQKALDQPPAEAVIWRQTLDSLLIPAAGGLWTAEGRLLYDLQKVCLDDEREVYAVDFVEWAVTWFRRPLRRHLPHQRLVLVLKNLRRALGRLPAVRLPPELRGAFHDLLHAAVLSGEERLRARFRPAARAALDDVGLTGKSRAWRVAREKVVEELLDRVVERDLLTMSDLRDAVARNRIKLSDLQGPEEFFLGDKLIRANRALAHHLDGVYRRGEIYLRWLQRLSSAAFGTRPGRFLTRYFALPFGGAFILVEGFKALRHELPGHHPHHAPDAALQRAHLLNDLTPTGILGLFLLALYVPAFRQGLVNGLHIARRALRALFVDLPAFVLGLPAVRELLQSRAYMLLYLFVLKPLIWGTIATLVLYLAGAGMWNAFASGTIVFLVTGILLNSPFGSHVEELIADRLVRVWQLIRHDLLPGAYYLVVGVFRALMERLERLLYAVDEWLRFRTGDSQLSAIVKPALGLVWFVFAYAVRAIINLFVEPTFNPIKHVPVVTVAAKLLVPFIKPLTETIVAAVEPILGFWLAGFVAGAGLFFIPGFAGFLVWELKENWRLYAANQPETLRPQVVGAHGETVRRLLQPGFHSGTLPKLFAKLRHAEGKAARKQEESLHHVAAALKRFVERELLAVLERSPRWGGTFRLRPGDVSLATNRIRLELRCRDLVDPPLCIDIDDEGGHLLAGVKQVGWLPRLSRMQRRALADALAGFYHLAGVELVREEMEALLSPETTYAVREHTLVVWSSSGLEGVYPLSPGPSPTPADGWPVLDYHNLLFSGRPILWSVWVAAWEQDDGEGRCEILKTESILPTPT